MSDIVRIMPRQPIAAVLEQDSYGGGSHYRAASITGCISVGDYEYANPDTWVEVSEPAAPIVWDGTDLAWVRVRAALPAGMEATASVDAPMTIYRSSDDRILATVIRGSRIRIEGDSFAILPPEVTE